MKKKLVFVVGARPNFIKAVPVLKAFRELTDHDCLLIHTGQHFDENMSGVFLKQLGIGGADINLDVGSGSHAVQTAKIMTSIEQVFLDISPDWVFVFGDVNSTIAAALVAAKLGIKVAHVESGLRSFDHEMPEEINRILTDRISDLLFVTEQSGLVNLKAEGVPDEKVCFVGNTMIDTLVAMQDVVSESTSLNSYGVTAGEYYLVTLHRPSNVDSPQKLQSLIDQITKWTKGSKVIWPIHPRVDQSRITLDDHQWKVIPPAGYIEFLGLMNSARAVITDSGGVQEETSFLGVPCMTLRNNTERPETCTSGTNQLIHESEIAGFSDGVINLEKPDSPPVIPLWDGKAAVRIVEAFTAIPLQENQ